MTQQANSALAVRLHAGARQLLRDRRPGEALPMLDRLARLPGLERPATLLRGEALAALGRLEEAEAAADLALAQDPECPMARQLRARIRLAGGQGDGAVEDAAAAVMAAPWDPAAKALLGTALLERRSFDEAIWFLGEAMASDPGNPGIRARLGQAFMRAGRHEAAAELLAACCAAEPAHPGHAALRAQNTLLTGDAAAAAALAREALAACGADPSLHSVLAHALVAMGRMTEAAPHFAAAARLAPGNGYLAHLAAAAEGMEPERATDAYLTAVFDGYAPRFEQSLLALGYRVPGLMRRLLERHLPDVASGEAKLGPVLDLGCGTGLVGVALADLLGGPLTGIDISPGMLEQAAVKHLYAALHHAEISEALRAGLPPQAVIIAADVFIYLGRLEEVLCLCRQALAPDGLLAFSVERLPGGGPDWRLGPAGRYAHAPGYLARCLAAAGLSVLEQREEDLRLEQDGPVPGLLVLARPAPH
ncbi:tetratricopeptide repeat protein [Belnapia sp. T6]|uniref:Tetratricopeptide repeat protein n=1 Tax=Belnapia mucosa TaxID=2804532 RepID=A0ABS1V0C8_9PROT|nr:tetratricopeptide repeat protein [Belnapia mucosa]MBL6454521.1 tetratricopeptide repeat protein [Belnapia mucosa]